MRRLPALIVSSACAVTLAVAGATTAGAQPVSSQSLPSVSVVSSVRGGGPVAPGNPGGGGNQTPDGWGAGLCELVPIFCS